MKSDSDVNESDMDSESQKLKLLKEQPRIKVIDTLKLEDGGRGIDDNKSYSSSSSSYKGLNKF